MRFRLIPPGEFVSTALGSMPFEQHNLYRLTKPFFLGATEVTVEEFARFADATGHKTDAERAGDERTWRKPWPNVPTDPKQPVSWLTTADMNTFCKWLGEQDGAVYRLPSQAEWRFACRAGNTTVFGVTDRVEDFDDYGWFGNDGPPLHPVGRKTPNPFGLFDVHGNITERFADGEYADLASSIDPVIPTLLGLHCKSCTLSGPVQPEQAFAHNPKHELIGFRVLRQTTKEPLIIPNPGKLSDKPILVGKGRPLSPQAAVSRPAPVQGVRSWSVELAGHQGVVGSVAWSPKGDLLATGGEHDTSVRLWDRDGNLKAVLLGHAEWVEGVAFSPDGTRLASCDRVGGESANGQSALRVWDVASGRCLVALQIPLWSSRVAFSPAGNEVAVGWCNQSLTVINLNTGAMRSMPGTNESFSWSPDGAALVGQTGGKLTVWDAATTKPLGELTAPDVEQDQPVGRTVAYSPDGKWIAAAAVGKVRLWDAKTRVHARTIDVAGASWVSWHPDSRRVAVLAEGQPFTVIDVAEAKVVAKGPAEGHDWLAWSPDGTELFGMPGNRPTFYDAATGKVKRQGPDRGRGNGDAIITPDARRVIWKHDLWDRRREFDTESGALVASPTAPVGRCLISSPDGTWSGYDQAFGKRLAVQHAGGKVVHLDPPTFSWAWQADPTGRWVAGAFGSQVIVWDVADGKRRSVHEHPSGAKVVPTYAARGFDWSPNGKRIATVATDKLVHLWDPADGKLLRTFDKFPQPPGGMSGAVSLAWDPDNRGLWVSLDHHAARLDTETGRVSPPESFSNGNLIGSLALAADGDRLLAWEGYGWTFLHDRDGSRRLLGQHLPFRPVWHPDARRFLGPTVAHGVRAFDTRRDHRLGTLWPQVSGDHWVCIGPDGHWRGSEGVESQIVYVAMLEDGSQKTYTPKEFADKFGWKNDPSKARLMKLDP